MAYTLDQLTMAWTAVHDGVAPSSETTSQLTLRTNVSFSDAQALSYVLNGADDTTAVAVLAYQFFTGKSPTKAGVDYLVNSAANPNDLNDAYFGKFNLENRYINFAANLGVNGEGAAAFATQYGAMNFSDYVASIYETIIGATYAKAAGVDVAAAVAYLIGTKDAVLATAKAAGMITDAMTSAQVDLALKAAMAGLVMAAAIKADIGLYAASADNFMLALAKGDAVYNTDITKTYAPKPGVGSQGTGRAIDFAPATLPGAPLPPPEPGAITMNLKAGLIVFGSPYDDTFRATDTTLTGVHLNGQDGIDTLTITAMTGKTYTADPAAVSNVEIVNIVNDRGVVIDTTSWPGVTTLNVTSGGFTDVTTDITTNVTANVSHPSKADVTVIGGQDVTVTVTDATSGAINIYGPAGDIVVNRASTGVTDAGPIVVVGGVNIDVTLTTALPDPGDTVDMGVVAIAGFLDTKTVKITGPASVADDGSHGEVIAAAILIQDFYSGSPDDLGTITSVEIDGFDNGGISFHGTALATLKAAHGTDIYIDNFGLTAPVVTTLNAMLDGIHGYFDDEGVFDTLNITHGPEDSDIDLGMDGLKTLTLGGQGVVTLVTDFSPNIETVTLSGAAGLNGDLSGLAGLTSVDTTATTGASDLTIDATKTTFTGGAGDDTVTLSGTSITKAIDLGGGDDTLVLAAGTGTPTATIDGGSGTRDTVMMSAADAATASGSGIFASKVVNFERLMLTNVSNQTIDVGALGYHHVTAESGAGLTLNGMTSGDTLELSAAGAGYTVNLAANGANDVLNLRLGDSAGAGLTFTSNLTIADIETLNVTTVDGRTTPTGATEILRITTGGQKVVNISGNAGVDLALGSTVLTSVDASGVTKGGLIWTAGAIGGPITIKGAANGTNQLNITQTTGVVTYEGGAGDDAITANSSNNSGAIIHFGGGNNQIVGYASVITAGSGNDNVNLANGGTNIDLGDGANTYYTPNQVSNTIKAGSGNDSITVGGGTASIDVGSGDDYVSIAFLAGSSFTSIIGMGAGDRLDLSNVSNAGAMGAKLVGQTTLGGYLSVAGAAVAGTTNAMQWFELNGDVYIVADQTDSTSFDAGTDGLVRLVGVAGILDVSLASVSGGGILFH